MSVWFIPSVSAIIANVLQGHGSEKNSRIWFSNVSETFQDSQRIPAAKQRFKSFVVLPQLSDVWQSSKLPPANSKDIYSIDFLLHQVLSETKSDPQKATYERLCLEVIGCLRRTLSLQGELKEVLYHVSYLRLSVFRGNNLLHV